jgi:hypothetical protein
MAISLLRLRQAYERPAVNSEWVSRRQCFTNLSFWRVSNGDSMAVPVVSRGVPKWVLPFLFGLQRPVLAF